MNLRNKAEGSIIPVLNLLVAWCQAEQGASLSAANGLLQRWVLHRHVYIVFPVTAVCSINKPIID